MSDTKKNTTFAFRLLDAEPDLEYGAALTGETRSQFMRRAIRERVARLERESVTNEEETSDGE